MWGVQNMQEQKTWQVKTSRRNDSWGDVGVLGVRGVMECSKHAEGRNLASENFKKG